MSDEDLVRLVEGRLLQTVTSSLSNGFTVLLSPDTTTSAVVVTLGVRVGYFDEPDELAGISHLLEHLFCARARGWMACRAPGQRSSVSGSTIYNHTTYTTLVQPPQLGVALEAMAEAFWAPSEGDSLVRERRVISLESARKADASASAIVEQLYAQLFPDHRVGRWRGGTRDSMRHISADAVDAFREAYYRPANSVLALAGNFDVSAALRAIDTSFVVSRPTPAQSVPSRSLNVSHRRHDASCLTTEQRDIALSRFAMGWRTPGVGSREAALCDVLAALVNADRHLRTLEQRCLGYSADVRHYIPGDVGIFVVRAEALPATLHDVFAVAAAAVNRFVTARPSPRKLEHAKRVVAASWAQALDRPLSRARCLAEWHLLSSSSTAFQSFHNAMAATAATVHDVARTWLGVDDRSACVHEPEQAAIAFTLGPVRRPRRIGKVRARQRVRLPACRVLSVEDSSSSGGVSLCRTTSGVPVLLAPSASADGLVSVGMYVHGGRADESPGVAGITAALLGTLERDNSLSRRFDLRREAAEMGFAVRALLDLNYCGWVARVRPEHVGRAVNLLSRVVQHATLTSRALEEHQFHALGVVARQYENGQRSSLSAALRAAYGDHAYGLPDCGSAAAIRELTVESVSRWREKLICAPRVAWAIVGPTSRAAVERTDLDVELSSATEINKDIPPRPTQIRTVHEHRPWRETALCALFPIPGLTTVPEACSDMITQLAAGTDSRLVDELRFRRGLCYTMSGFVRARKLSGAIGFCAATAPQHVAECRDIIIGEFLRLARGDIGEYAFQAAKRHTAATWTMNERSVGSRAHYLVTNWFIRGRVAGDDYPRELAKLSPQLLAAAIQDWGDVSSPVVGLVGVR